jgi:hypothetical protein
MKPVITTIDSMATVDCNTAGTDLAIGPGTHREFRAARSSADEAPPQMVVLLYHISIEFITRYRENSFIGSKWASARTQVVGK